MMAEKKDKAPKKKKPYHLYALYEAKGDKAERKRKTCPKCGPSIFLAEHKDRISCGKCKYTEYKQR